MRARPGLDPRQCPERTVWRLAARAAWVVTLCVTALSAPARVEAGEERRVAVVVDRSASLRHADPRGEGLQALVQALALSLAPSDRLALSIGDGGALQETSLAQLAQALPLLRALSSAAPRPGGAGLEEALVAASRWAGSAGLVLIYTDDDLDVIGASGAAPPEALALAQREEARPTREGVNRAALRLLRQAVLRERVHLVGAVAPLPGSGRTTPFLEALGAERIALDSAGVPRLAARIGGRSLVGAARVVAAGTREERLAYPSRVTVASAEPLEFAEGQRLDALGRLWLIDASAGPLALPEHAGLVLWIAPRLKPIAGALAYRLREGGIRVVAPGALSGAALALVGGRELVLKGEPPRADFPRTSGAVRVARVAGQGADRATGPWSELEVRPVELLLTPDQRAEVGRPLEFSGQLPTGFAPDELEVEAVEGGGQRQDLSLARPGVWSYRPRSSGPVDLRARGPLALRLASPVEVAPAPSYAFRLEEVLLGGVPVDLAHPLPRGGRVELKLRVSVAPEPSEPLAGELRLGGVAGARLIEPQGALEVGPSRELRVVLELPEEVAEAEQSLGLSLEPSVGATLPGRRGLPIAQPRSLWRLGLALGLIALAALWFLILLISRRRDRSFLDLSVGSKQLRTVGSNGRISPERYLFSQHFLSREEGVLIEPEDSVGGALRFQVRRDGLVECLAEDGAKLIHEDRPTVLANVVQVRHGTAFAMVYGQRALRYVYLEDEPTAEELGHKLFGDQASYEDELRDSGVFVLLDDDENVPKASARMEASAEILFPISSQSFDSSGELDVVPSDSGRQYPVSDEGIVVMNSDEGAILDSEDLDLLTSGELRSAESEFDRLGAEISLGDILGPPRAAPAEPAPAPEETAPASEEPEA